jgi:hypothetical protein
MLLNNKSVVREMCQTRASQFTWENTAQTLLLNYQVVTPAPIEKILNNTFEFGQVA